MLRPKRGNAMAMTTAKILSIDEQNKNVKGEMMAWLGRWCSPSVFNDIIHVCFCPCFVYAQMQTKSCALGPCIQCKSRATHSIYTVHTSLRRGDRKTGERLIWVGKELLFKLKYVCVPQPKSNRPLVNVLLPTATAPTSTLPLCAKNRLTVRKHGSPKNILYRIDIDILFH